MHQLVISSKQASAGAGELQVNALRLWIGSYELSFCTKMTETQRQTLQAASTYRPAISADPMTSFFAPPLHPLPAHCSLFFNHLQVCLAALVQHTSRTASLTADQSFAFISIFLKITCQL